MAFYGILQSGQWNDSAEDSVPFAVEQDGTFTDLYGGKGVVCYFIF